MAGQPDRVADSSRNSDDSCEKHVYGVPGAIAFTVKGRPVIDAHFVWMSPMAVANGILRAGCTPSPENSPSVVASTDPR